MNNKFNAKKIVLPDGKRFDSKKEYLRYLELAQLQANGKISHLQTQVDYELIPAQKSGKVTLERKCCYRADFVYNKNGDVIVEDVKSPITRKQPEYIIKRKLMLWKYGIQIKEV